MSWPQYVRGARVFHVTRTNIAGCTTVCGVKLREGQELIPTLPPLASVCEHCRDPYAAQVTRR